MRSREPRWFLIVVHVCVLLPLLWLLWDFTQDQLTANPIREIQLRTGIVALTLLVLTLACSPVYSVFGARLALQLRRLFGLYAFVYAGLHLINFIGLDYGFNFPLVWKDIADKRFVVAGLAALLILAALSATSTRAWKSRLGKNWKRLHQLIYVAAILAVLHFIWQTKADFRLPFIFGALVILLFIFRIPRVKDLTRLRGQRLRKELDSDLLAEDV